MKQTLRSRVLAALLSLVMLAGLTPGVSMTAFAADTGKAIQLVDNGTAANIFGGQADNIYFGRYQQRSAGSTGIYGVEGVDWIKSDTAILQGQGPYYYIDPVKWRVLENADGRLFLLSDQNLDVFRYHNDGEDVTWEKSTMRSWLNGYGASENIGGDYGKNYTNNNFIDTAFSEKEQRAVAETTVVNKDNPEYGTEGGNNTTDKIFLLSIAEAESGSYFADDASRQSTNTDYVVGGGEISGDIHATYWWLRSPDPSAQDAVHILDSGRVYRDGEIVFSIGIAVRPAFHLDLDSVLFTSAAAGGKSASGMDSGLAAVDNYDGNEWKLTLLDSGRSSFSAHVDGQASVSAAAGGSVQITYSGAQTGDHEYVSVLLCDSGGNVLYYGISPRTAQAGRRRSRFRPGLPTGITR